uniref:Uncharacterized protein n=1 Tax=Globodera rostochiensis TaxID=31243 RepID=A0A914HT69_GLORO
MALFATNLFDKTESVKLELKTFDEIFGEGWWDKGEAAEDLKTPAPTNFGQNVHHQIDRQTPKLDKLNLIQLISLDKLNPIQLISLDKLNPIQLIKLDKLNPIQLISLDKLNPIQLIRILLSGNLITLIMPKMVKNRTK